jgi:hypothetical protein
MFRVFAVAAAVCAALVGCNSKDTPDPLVGEADWTTAAQGVHIGDLEVTLRTAQKSRPLCEDAGQFTSAPDDAFLVHVRIQNHSEDKRLEYKGWSDRASKRTGARLSDDTGRVYNPVNFGPDLHVQGQKFDVTLQPGEMIEDILLFEIPDPDFKYLRLELPGRPVGITESIRLQLARNNILLSDADFAKIQPQGAGAGGGGRRQQQQPKKDEPKKDDKKTDEKKDEPKKDEPKKDEPKKDEPKKDEPKKDEPKKGPPAQSPPPAK